MPRCYSCGTFTKSPHREMDGRTYRSYCDFCHAEREWKLDDEHQIPGQPDKPISPPPLSWWSRFRQWLGRG